MLATLAALFPWELGEKADAFAPAFRDIRPEWYFVFLFETLKLVPGGEIAGIEYEAFPILLSGAFAVLFVLVPFFDRGGSRAASVTVTVLGVVAVVYAVAMTAWGYRSWVPVGVVVGTLLMLAVLARVTRHDPGAALVDAAPPRNRDAEGPR